MKLLERYILRETIKPFLVSLTIVTFIFLIDKIIDLLNLIIEKRLDIAAIVSVFSLSIPFIVALSVPMSVLVAIIITFGRLSVDNELTAFKSCGINIYTLMRSSVVAALVLSAFMIYFNNEILPETNHKLKNLLVRLHHRRPVTSIRPGTFTTVKNYTIFAFDVEDDKLRKVTIFDKQDAEFPATITAETGEIILADGGNNFKAILHNGQLHERGKEDPSAYTLSSFDELVIHLPDLGYQINIEDAAQRGDREMTTKQMITINELRREEINSLHQEIASLQRRINNLEDLPDSREVRRDINRLENLMRMHRNKIDDVQTRIREFQVEIHKKYAIAIACLIFVLLGVPIGMMIKTSGVGGAFTASTFIFIVYYICLVLGEQLGDRGQVPPFIAMWAPNILFGAIGIYLLIKSTKDTKTINVEPLKQYLTQKYRKLVGSNDNSDYEAS